MLPSYIAMKEWLKAFEKRVFVGVIILRGEEVKDLAQSDKSCDNWGIKLSNNSLRQHISIYSRWQQWAWKPQIKWIQVLVFENLVSKE